MKRFLITYTDNTTNTVIGTQDIWTGLPNVTSVQDLGADTVALSPAILSKIEFQDHAIANLGGGIEGMSVFQDILDVASTSSGAIKFAYTRYEVAQSFTKDQVILFLGILVQANIVTQEQYNAVINNWPEA